MSGGSQADRVEPIRIADRGAALGLIVPAAFVAAGCWLGMWLEVPALGLAPFAFVAVAFFAKGLAVLAWPDCLVIDPAAPMIRFLQPGEGSGLGPRLRREIVRADVRGLRVVTFREPARRVSSKDSTTRSLSYQSGADLNHDLAAAEGPERAAILMDVAGRRFPVILWVTMPSGVPGLREFATRAAGVMGVPLKDEVPPGTWSVTKGVPPAA